MSLTARPQMRGAMQLLFSLLDFKMTNTVKMLKTRPSTVMTMLPMEVTRADVLVKVEVEFILSILFQDWNFPLTCWYGFSGNPLICYLGNISDKPSKIAKIASCLHDCLCLVFTSSDMTIVQITTVFLLMVVCTSEALIRIHTDGYGLVKIQLDSICF